MKFKDLKNDVDVRVEITPLIDVVFLLLIFFMISTTFITTPGLRVDLPQASTHEIKLDNDSVSITITPDGHIHTMGEDVSMDKLTEILKQAYIEDPDTLIILRADEMTFHGRVVNVMDLIKTVGLERIAIATKYLKEE